MSVIATYLLMNSLLMISFFLDSSQDRFVLLTLSVNFFLISFILLSEYPGLFFPKKQSDILFPLPVKEEEFFFSKALSGIVYLSVFPFTLALPQAVYFYFYEQGLPAALHFFAVNLLFSYFSLGVIFLLYGIFISFSKGKSKLPLILFQILFVFFVLYINRLINSDPDTLFSKQSAFIAYLPQYYLLLSFSNKIYAVIAAAGTALIYLTAFLLFRKKYSELSEILNSADTHSVRKLPFPALSQLLKNTEHLFVRNKTERASFYLIKNVYRNSAVIKLRTVILFFLPLIALSVGLILNIPEMIYVQEEGYELFLISPSVSVVILMSLKLIISGFKIPADQDTDIDWVYDSVPLENKLLFRRGCVKFTLFYYLIPVSVISGLFLLIAIPAADIILNILYLLTFSLLFTELVIRAEKSLPFTDKNPKFGSAAKYIDAVSVILSGTVFFVSQIIIFKNVIFTVSAVIIFLIIYLAVTELKISKKNT
ncbi:MAG: hypothetical protein MUE56_00650 [Ignavibacteria bacterium]|nr:hypothetical protein [Ignavibacteria bacterium]